MKDLLLWTDIETNGLELDRHRILEVAMVLTDENLNELGAIERVIIPYKYGMYDVGSSLRAYLQTLHDAAVPFVQEMHTKNGLWDALYDKGEHQEHAATGFQAWLSTLIEEHVQEDGTKRKPLMAGASVHFDRKFMDKEFPELMDLCHYRMFDVSSLKRMCEWWIPGDKTPYDHLTDNPIVAAAAVGVTQGQHRAMSDIRLTIAEAAFIRKDIDSQFWDFGKET